MCGQWHRWHTELIRPIGKKNQSKEKLLPASIQEQLEQAVEQLTKLQELVGGKLAGEKPGRRRRGTVRTKIAPSKRRKKDYDLFPDLLSF